MSWSDPIVLWGLLGPAFGAVTLLVLAFLRRHRRWTRWPGITRIVAIGTTVHPVGVAHGTRRPWLMLVALALALVALAGPRWGSIDEPVYQKSREVMIALDLSRSMLAEDVPPSRLERSRLLVRTLLDSLKGERVGLIAFAGTAFVQVPMSADYQILEEFLPELKPTYMPQGGTDYDGMLRAALGGFSEIANTDRYLIVLSDGESTTEGWRERIPTVKEKGIHIIALGVGTTTGGFIPDATTGAFVKDARGAVVLSRLEPATLQALATQTGGTYRDASSWLDLPAVLAETIERGQQGEFAEKRASRPIERFQWFLAPALLLTLLGVWREIPARPRARQIHKGLAGRPAASTPASVLTALMVLLLLPGTPAARAAVEDTTPATAADKLRSTVTRLAAADNVAPAGWKAMAEQTLALAEEWTKAKQPPDAGIVNDALQAVDQGEALSARAADWPKLREDLLRLLEPPPPEQQQQQQQQDEQKNEDEEKQDQEQQKSDQQQSGGEGESKDPSQSDQDPQEGQQPKDKQQEPQKQQSPAEQKQDSALGDLEKQSPEDQPQPGEPQPPKDPPQSTQKFGGRQNEEQQEPPTDPALAAAQARLRQVGENDSPAHLHQRMEEEAQRQTKQQPAPANTRDW